MTQSDIPSTAVPAARPSAWTAGRITAVVVGSLLALISLGLLSGGGLAFWGEFQRDSGYVTTSAHEFSTAGSALTTERIQLGSAGVGWLYAPGLLDKVRIRVTPTTAGEPVFVGIGPSDDVDRYLGGVRHTVITDYWGDSVEPVGGGTTVSPPTKQGFWAASTTGAGETSLRWNPRSGSWTVVVMNANGRPGVDVTADLGARVPNLLWIGIGLFAVGAVLLAGAVLLIVGAIRRTQRKEQR